MPKPSLALVCLALLGPAAISPVAAEDPISIEPVSLPGPLGPLLGATCDARETLPPAATREGEGAWTLHEVDAAPWSGYEAAMHVADGRTAYVAAKRFHAEPPADAYAPAELRVSRTSDAGRTWRTSVVDADAVEDGTLLDQSVAIGGAGRTVLVAYLRAPAGDAAQRSLHLARSEDAGATWTLSVIRPAYEGGHLSLRVIDPSTAALSHRDLSRAPHNGNLEILLTRDGGRTWSAAGALNASSGWYAALDARSARDMQVVHYDASGERRALDLGATTDGRTWSNRTLRQESCWHSGLAPTLARTPGRSLVTYEEHAPTMGLTRLRVATSTDEGATWTHAALDDVGGLALDTATVAHDAQRAWNAWFRVGEDGVRAVRLGETQDGGASWTLRTLPDAAGGYLDLGRHPDGGLLVAYQTAGRTLRVAALDA